MMLIPFWLFQNPESFQVDLFEKYGPFSIAALAIIVLFWVMKMQNDRDLKRDEQMAKKDTAFLEALNKIVVSLARIEERLP